MPFSKNGKMHGFFSNFFCHAAILRITRLIIKHLKSWQMRGGMAAKAKIKEKGHKKIRKIYGF